MLIECESCGREFERRSLRGRVPRFCGQTCRKRASRAVKAPFANDKRVWVRASGKRPIMVDGSAASSTDPATWVSFAEAQSGAGDGFGVMLGDGLACIDLDHCFDSGGELLPWASTAIESVKPVFIERSLSGAGVHVFHEQEPARYHRDVFGAGKVEWFSHSRFIRMTLDSFKL